MINSPLTGSENVTLEKEANTVDIIELYRRNYLMDVKRFFSEVKKISVYKCNESDYRFFYPPGISGDALLYEKLEKYEWYYMPWKWEHEQAMKRIHQGMKILEVGCGKGDFLKKISSRLNIETIGLELNSSAVQMAQMEGVNVIGQSIDDYSKNNAGQFDIVCSFQVAEHIYDVKSFLSSQIRCLKKNGLLIVSVPNNDSFLKWDEMNPLNLPPHHMGLWNRKSLSFIADIFDLKLVEIIIEPLQNYHTRYFITTLSHYFKEKYFIPFRITLPVLKIFLYFFSDKIRGHSILAIYKKAN